MRTSKKKQQVIDEEHTYANGRVWNNDSLAQFREYQKQFIKETYRTFLLRMNKNKDAKLIEWLESQDNLSSYIKDLILNDMLANGVITMDDVSIDDLARWGAQKIAAERAAARDGVPAKTERTADPKEIASVVAAAASAEGTAKEGKRGRKKKAKSV